MGGGCCLRFSGSWNFNNVSVHQGIYQVKKDGVAISKHGVVAANQSIALGLKGPFDRTIATKVYLLPNQKESL